MARLRTRVQRNPATSCVNVSAPRKLDRQSYLQKVTVKFGVAFASRGVLMWQLDPSCLDNVHEKAVSELDKRPFHTPSLASMSIYFFRVQHKRSIVFVVIVTPNS